MKKKICILLIALSMMVIGAGCGAGSTTDAQTSEEKTETATEPVENSTGGNKELKVLRVVTTEGQEPIVQEAKKYFEEHGYTFEVNIVEMNKMVPEAISDGSADLGMGVHLKFMERFNEENNGTAAMAEPYPWYGGLGLFSKKYDDFKAIPDGGQIAVMTDAMNQDRGLRMLEEAGLIVLDSSRKSEDTLYGVTDIKENPHNFKFIELDQTQTVRAMEDVDASVCFFSHIINSGGNVDDAILVDTKGEKYPSGFVLSKEMKGTELEKIAADSLFTDSMREFVKSHFKGAYTFLD